MKQRSKAEPAPFSAVRVVVGYLIAAGPVGSGTWRWRVPTTLALVGPGSVPFALMLFFSQNQMFRDDYLISWGMLPSFATAAAVVMARFRPVEAWALVLVSMLGTMFGADHIGWLPWPLTPPNLFALMVVLFALGRDRRPRTGVLAWLSYLALGLASAWMLNAQLATVVPDPVSNPSSSTASDNLLLGSLFGALTFLVGLTVRIWREGRERVAEEEQVAEAERHRRRLLEERTRIARELHDIVAHHMSVIAVQSSTAEYRLADLSEEARAEFRSISGQARESLAEMRRLLGVLRSEDEAGAREPLPGPEALRGLAEAVDRAGTPVSLRVGALPGDLPETVALTVFRVVQEALSNVVRHAPGAATEVEVAVVDGQVTVTVVNGPAPAGAVATDAQGSGLGLVGMRERVSLEGGTVETGPTAAGGFRVHAVLPVEDRSSVEESL